MKGLYRKLLRIIARAFALQFCKLYAIEQRDAGAQAARDHQEIKALGHYQNAVAAETMVREITIERTNEFYNKYAYKTTSIHDQNETRCHASEH